MKLGYLAIAAVTGTLFAQPALAQDMDWTGFYLGGNVGYTVTDSNAEFTDPMLAALAAPIPSGQKGLLGGIQAGANFQSGMVVVGIEAGATIGNVSATYADPTIGIPGAAVAGDTVTSGSDFQATLLGRVGLGIDSFLPYLVGGVAVAHVHTSATAGGADDDGMFAGLAYGAGVEFALDSNWSLRGQYLHTELSGSNFNVGKAWETSASPSSDTITFGVNYRF